MSTAHCGPWRLGRWFEALAAMAAGLAACLLAAPAAAQSCVVDAARPVLDRATGVESVDARVAGQAVTLKLVRLSPGDWAIRLIDMRDLRQLKARRGDYTAPGFSLTELSQQSAVGAILGSAGMTESLSMPIPVGLLKVDGKIRSRANAASRQLDGVLCLRYDRGVSLLSEVSVHGRRIPADAEAATRACAHAVQTGPMLVERSRPLIGRDAIPHRGVRIFAALDRDGRFIFGHAAPTSAYALACVLALPALAIDAAINLQGDEQGGVLFKPGSGLASGTWGRDNATIASVIEAVRRKGR